MNKEIAPNLSPENICAAMLDEGRQLRNSGNTVRALEVFNGAMGLNGISNVFLKNKILYEIEVTQKKTVLQSRPQNILLTLTSRCNLQCKMCCLWDLPNGYDIPEKIVHELKSFYPYLEEIVWSGGEVFLSKHFKKLFVEASQYKKIKHTVTTNGLLINEEWAELLSGANTQICYSIDGVTKETYENLRKGGRFEDLLKSIAVINRHRKSSAYRMRKILSFVVMRSNYMEMGKALDFAKEYGYDTVEFTPLNNYMHLENEDLFDRYDKETAVYMENMRDKVMEKSEEFNIEVQYELPVMKKGSCQKEVSLNIGKATNSENELFCYMPWRWLSLIALGKAKAACYCPREIGDIADSSLEEIWNGKAMQEYRQKIADGCFDWCSKGCVEGCTKLIHKH